MSTRKLFIFPQRCEWELLWWLFRHDLFTFLECRIAFDPFIKVQVDELYAEPPFETDFIVSISVRTPDVRFDIPKRATDRAVKDGRLDPGWDIPF